MSRTASTRKRCVDGSTLNEEAKEQLRADLPNAAARAEEFRTLMIDPPNLTFDRELNLELGNREVQLKFLGRGNTSGDVIAWLPDSQVVAAGDLLVYPFPFLIGGFPREWSATLQRIAGLHPKTIIPGHGAVLFGDDGTNYLRSIEELLSGVSAVVQAETFKLGNGPQLLDEVMVAVKRSPDIAALRRRFAGDDADRAASFDQSLPNLIKSSYREAWGN